MLFSLALARTMGHVNFQGQTFGEVMSAVPYISGCIFCIAVFLGQGSVKGFKGELGFLVTFTT